MQYNTKWHNLSLSNHLSLIYIYPYDIYEHMLVQLVCVLVSLEAVFAAHVKRAHYQSNQKDGRVSRIVCMCACTCALIDTHTYVTYVYAIVPATFIHLTVDLEHTKGQQTTNAPHTRTHLSNRMLVDDAALFVRLRRTIHHRTPPEVGVNIQYKITQKFNTHFDDVSFVCVCWWFPTRPTHLGHSGCWLPCVFVRRTLIAHTASKQQHQTCQ